MPKTEADITRKWATQQMARFAPEEIPTHDPPEWRSDARLIRHLTRKYDLKWALDWQKAPIISIPRGFVGSDHWKSWASSIQGRDLAVRLPFDDFVIDTWAKRWADDPEGGSIHTWIRVRSLLRISEDTLKGFGRKAPWIDKAVLAPDVLLWEEYCDYPDVEHLRSYWGDLTEQAMSEIAVCEHFHVHSGGEGESCNHINPLLSMLHTNKDLYFPCLTPEMIEMYGYDRMKRGAGLPPELQRLVDDQKTQADGIWKLLLYISSSPDYLVEVRPSGRPTYARDPAKAGKPWLRTHLPHIIFYDPKVKRRRVEAEGHEPAEGSPKRRHHRMGGWATLLAPRFYLHWPYSEDLLNFTPREMPVAPTKPQYVTEVFVSGMDAHDRPHVWKKFVDGWGELRVRQVWRKESWPGTREWTEDDENGQPAVYRVSEANKRIGEEPA